MTDYRKKEECNSCLFGMILADVHSVDTCRTIFQKNFSAFFHTLWTKVLINKNCIQTITHPIVNNLGHFCFFTQCDTVLTKISTEIMTPFDNPSKL